MTPNSSRCCSLWSTIHLSTWFVVAVHLNDVDLLICFRLMGLTAVVTMDCYYQPWGMHLNAEATWPMYVNPGVIYLLYYVAVVNFKGHDGKVKSCMFAFLMLTTCQCLTQHLYVII